MPLLSRRRRSASSTYRAVILKPYRALNSGQRQSHIVFGLWAFDVIPVAKPQGPAQIAVQALRSIQALLAEVEVTVSKTECTVGGREPLNAVPIKLGDVKVSRMQFEAR